MTTAPYHSLADVAADPHLAARFRSSAVELIDGRELRQALPSTAVVAAAVGIAAAFDAHVFGLRVGVREPVAAPPADLLRPEISLMRPGAASVAGSWLPADRVALAVLVVDQAAHAQSRLRRYALAGVAEVWVVAVLEGAAAAYREARAGLYRRRELLLPGEECAPEAMPWASVVPLPERGAQSPSPLPASSLASISNASPANSITSPGPTRRLRRVST